MSPFPLSRRKFMVGIGAALSAPLLAAAKLHGQSCNQDTSAVTKQGAADYTLTIATTPLEVAPTRILSVTTYNGQFPGPLLRFKEGQRVTVEIHNETDTPEQLHWHGQFVSTEVDGAAEEGTPFIPPHVSRRISWEPRPAGLRLKGSTAADVRRDERRSLFGRPIYLG